MPVVAKLVAEISADIRGLKAGLDEANRRIADLDKRANAAGQGVNQGMSKLGAKFTSMGRNISEVGRALTVGVTLPVFALGKASVDAAVKMDSMQRGLAAIMGSSAKANAELTKLKEVAKLPGLGIAEAAQGSLRLQSVRVGADKAREALMQFGNAIALVGGGKAQLETVTFQLAQMFGAMKLKGNDINAITNAVPMLRQILKDAYGTLDFEKINKQFNVNQVFDTMVAGLQKLPRITDTMKNKLENFTDSIFYIFAKLGTAILPPLTKVLDVVGPIIQKLTDMFMALPPEVQQGIVVFAALAAVVGPLMVGVGALIPVITAIGALFEGLGAPILIVVAAIAALSTAFATNFMGIRDMVQPIIKGVIDVFQMLGKYMQEVFKEVWPEVVSTFKEVSKELEPVVKDFQKFFTEAFGDIKKWLQENWPWIKEIIVTTIRGALITVKELAAAFKAFWNDWGGLIMAATKQNWDFVAGVFKAVFETIRLLVSAFTNFIKGDWKAALIDIAHLTSNIGDMILGAWRKFNQTLISIFTSIAQAIVIAARNWFQAALTAGTNIISGVVQGVRSMIPRAVDAIGSMARSVMNTMTGILKIHSPSEVFEEYGQMVGEGFGLGIKKSHDFVIDMASVMAGDATEVALYKLKLYLDSIDQLTESLQSERLQMDLLLATDEKHRAALEMLKTTYESLTEEQQKYIDGIANVREMRKSIEDMIQNPIKVTPDPVIKNGPDEIEHIKMWSEAIMKAKEAEQKITDSLASSIRAATVESMKLHGTWTILDDVLENLHMSWDKLTDSQREMVLELVHQREEMEYFKKYQKDLEDYKAAIENAARAISGVLTSAFNDAYNTGFKSFFTNVIEGFRRMLFQMAVEYLQSQLMQLLQRSLFGAGGIFGTIFGGGGGSSSSLYAPGGNLGFAANGGNVNAFQPMIVGEYGPELFLPGVSGSIVSNTNLKNAAFSGGNTSSLISTRSSEMGGSSRSDQTVIHYSPVYHITTPNPEEFKKSQRQILTDGKRQLDEMSRRLR